MKNNNVETSGTIIHTLPNNNNDVYDYYIRATDNVSRTDEKYATLIADFELPVNTINSPNNNDYSTEGNNYVAVYYNVNDIFTYVAEVKVLLNDNVVDQFASSGQSGGLDGDRFTTVDNLIPGNNKITIWSKDLAGNEDAEDINFIYDTKPYIYVYDPIDINDVYDGLAFSD